jgi:arylsulfatase A-like enzyme/Flp pilus assembly protein TadD
MASRQAARRSGRKPLPPPAAGGRRRSRALVAGVLTLAAAAGIWWFARPRTFVLTPDANRNVLLVTIDTLRADALSSYGGKAETPNVDRVAAMGARFTFAHASAVVTLVSHTTILTGEYPYAHGVRNNSGYRLAEGTPTLATRLKAAGFATGAFIGGYPLVHRFGLAPGFDVYDDQLGAAAGPGRNFALPERRADAVVARAVDWIDKQSGRFFAWVHVFDPHAPYMPPAEWLAKYRAQPYYGEVAWTDHALGPLFDRLATLPRPTLVVITGDHGEGLGDHGEATHGIFAYESTLHVPLIVAVVDPARARAPRGVTIDAAVRHIDIVPTILEAAGLPADPSLPGASLIGMIRRGGGADRPEYFEAMTNNLTRGWAPLRGVLVGRDKYVDLPIQELYNLVRDPAELHNLAPTSNERVAVLLNVLRSYNTAAPGQPVRETEAVAEKLRALGYVSGGPLPEKASYTEADDPKRLIGIDQDLHAGTDFFDKGRYQDAIDAFRRALAARPDTADAYKYLAYVYWQTGRPNLAIQTLENALSHGVTDQDVTIRLGTYFSDLGEARKAFDLFQALPQDDPAVLNGLGVAEAQLGHDAEASAAFQHAVKLDPSNGMAYQNIAALQLAAALAPGRSPSTRDELLAEAEASVRRAIEADPSIARSYTTLGVLLANTGRRSQAIDAWKQAVALDRTEFDALYNLTLELAAAGQRDEARTYGEQFLATAPPASFGQDFGEIRRVIGK